MSVGSIGIELLFAIILALLAYVNFWSHLVLTTFLHSVRGLVPTLYPLSVRFTELLCLTYKCFLF